MTTMTTTFELMGEEFSIEGDLSEAPTPTNRGLSLMEELRSQLAQRSTEIAEATASNPFTGITSSRYKDLFNLIEEQQLMGMMLMFNFLHNCGENEMVKHSASQTDVEHVLCLLDDLRNYIQLRMHPVQDDYLSTEPFDDCDSAFDLRMKLGDAKLKGALTVFNLLHPEEVKPVTGAPISFTLTSYSEWEGWYDKDTTNTTTMEGNWSYLGDQDKLCIDGRVRITSSPYYDAELLPSTAAKMFLPMAQFRNFNKDNALVYTHDGPVTFFW